MPSFGLKPRTFDARDYKLATFLPDGWREQLDAFKAAKRGVYYDPKAFTDQNGKPHCTTFTDADYQNTPPVVRSPLVGNQEAHDWYYQMVAWLGRPRDEGGAEMRELCQWMQKEQKRIGAYAWASGVEEIQWWLAFRGPVLAGTVWLSGMGEKVDVSGFVHVWGWLMGYHAWSFVAWDSATDVYTGLNHWDSMDLFKVSGQDTARLLAEQGEFVMTFELPREPLPSGCWARVMGKARWGAYERQNL